MLLLLFGFAFIRLPARGRTRGGLSLVLRTINDWPQLPEFRRRQELLAGVMMTIRYTPLGVSDAQKAFCWGRGVDIGIR
ncbi:hypothetical protein CCR95_17880 [Thiocystis minor]|nr:hypothetical protein [Thiocystis minor]